MISDEELNRIEQALEDYIIGNWYRGEFNDDVRSLVADLRVEREANAKLRDQAAGLVHAVDLLAEKAEVEREVSSQLRAAILAIHESRIEEAEVWIDGPGEGTHRDQFPDCTDCEGHTVNVQVCSECGYDHDVDQPIYRKWPCPTAAVASYLLNEDATK